MAFLNMQKSANTSENVVLVVLVGNSTEFYQARKTIVLHKLVHEVLVVLEDLFEGKKCTTLVPTRHVQ